MKNIFYAPLYFTANAAASSDVFSTSVSVLVIRMLSILLGIVILHVVIYIMYILRPKPFLE